jgi:hypothetical protein
MKHKPRWERIENSGQLTWRLHNEAGVKIWLTRGLKSWVLYLGDNDTAIAGENNRIILSGNFSEEVAKRASIGRAIGYLQDLIQQLEKFRGVTPS